MEYWIDGQWVEAIPAQALVQNEQVIVDFGAEPSHGKEFVISDARCKASSIINVSMAYVNTANNAADEIEMSKLICAAGLAFAGGFRLYVGALDGPVTGKFAVNYILG